LLSSVSNIETHLLVNGGDAVTSIKNQSQLKLNVYPFSNSKTSLIKHIRFFVFLTKYCKENKIDIIHTHHRYPELVAYFVSKNIKVKTITTAHSFVNGMKYLSFKSDLIIAVSDAVKKHIISNYPASEKKIIKQYNCIDIRFYEYSNHQQDGKNIFFIKNDCQKIFLYAGRISFAKGSDLLIESFIKLTDDYKNICLILIGDLYDKQVFDKFRYHNQVKFFKTQKNIGSFLKKADFIVLPSLAESFPYLMLEAGIYKKLFIGSQIGGIEEFIEDGVNGLLFKPADVSDLNTKMKFALDNQDLVNDMAIRLEVKVKENCSPSKYFNALLEIYNKMVN